ncbi:Translin [Amylocarpus encephaloides]|uniref:Translin n=1 Tax=Amylocarpus encephaloides TaxID=45428 RepID=A0A9P7YQU1_9HELO|nr:Translin [Amylocarpus encephaloides]
MGEPSDDRPSPDSNLNGAKSNSKPGFKRKYENGPRDDKAKKPRRDVEASSSPFMPMFENFRDELDEHHDRRERVIKASRDITAASKKIIFALQRVRKLNSEIPESIAGEVLGRSKGMKAQFDTIAPDLTGLNAWRYQRQISGGIQEYMEAVSFEHYLRNQRLIPLEESSRLLPETIPLTGDDYVLGIFDLVGELMRFAITTIATTGSLPSSSPSETDENTVGSRDVLQDLRSLRASFQALDTTSCGGTGLGKDVEKKMEVMKACVEKVETAVYGLIVRGRERPKGWVPDLLDDRAPVTVESY